MFRQEQAILRSLPPPSSLAADSIKLWWTWRRANKNASTRSLMHTLVATLSAAGFVAIGILTSTVVSTSDLEVLVSSPHCGRINTTLAPMTNLRAQTSQLVSLATPYAAECYDHQKILSARCRAFVHPSVSFPTERTACPFSREYCLESTTNDTSLLPAVTFDSGLVDVNRAFGMNLPKNEAVSYRRRSTCTVLPLSGHEFFFDGNQLPGELWGRARRPNTTAVVLSYGKQPQLGQWDNITTLYDFNDMSVQKKIQIQ